MILFPKPGDVIRLKDAKRVAFQVAEVDGWYLHMRQLAIVDHSEDANACPVCAAEGPLYAPNGGHLDDYFRVWLLAGWERVPKAVVLETAIPATLNAPEGGVLYETKGLGGA